MKQKTIIVNADVLTTLNAARQTISQCGWKVAQMDESSIKASTGISMKSWGETILVQIKVSGGTTYLNIQSTSTVPSLFDWGRNQDNIDMFITTLHKLISITKLLKK